MPEFIPNIKKNKNQDLPFFIFVIILFRLKQNPNRSQPDSEAGVTELYRNTLC